MQICRTLAGYSYARADIVRRAMSKKDEAVMLAERDAFLSGARERGIDAEAAEAVFDEMVGFAKYAFNKSHATAYAILTYRTAYLKAHYPAEFFAALLTSVLDQPEKVRAYITDAERCGVHVLRPDINESRAYFAVTDGHIRYGLLAIRNVGRHFADAIMAERQKSRFRSMDDFVTRMSASEINRRSLETLIKSGVFDSLGVTRSALMSVYETVLADAQGRMRNNISGQMDMFSLVSQTASDAFEGYSYPAMEEYSKRELLMMEKEASGMYFSGHLLDGYSDHIRSLSVDRIVDIIADFAEEAEQVRYKDRSEVHLAALVSSVRTKEVKGGQTMAFLRIDDTYGELEVLVFPKAYAKLSEHIHEEAALYITGVLSEEEGEAPRVLLSTLQPLRENGAKTVETDGTGASAAEQKPIGGRLFIKVKDMKDTRITALERTVLFHPGDCAVVLYDTSTGKYVAMKNMGIEPTEAVLTRLRTQFTSEGVVYRP